jgi:hypothetical protein
MINTHILTIAMVFLMSITGMNLQTDIKLIRPVANETTATVRTIILNSNDLMKFNRTEIRVKDGEN